MLQGWYNHFAYKVQHHCSGRRTTSSWKGGLFFPLVSMRPCMPKCAHVWWVKDFMQVALGRHELTAENNPICKTAPIWLAPSFLSLYHVLTDGIGITRIKDSKDLLAYLSFYCQARLLPCRIFSTAFNSFYKSCIQSSTNSLAMHKPNGSQIRKIFSCVAFA